MIFIDTNVFVDALRGRNPAGSLVRRLVDAGRPIAVAAPTAAELWEGAHRHPRPQTALRQVGELLEGLRFFPFDAAAARQYGEIVAGLRKSGQEIPIMDAQIASIVYRNGGRLVTRDRRHFDRVVGLEVVDVEDV